MKLSAQRCDAKMGALASGAMEFATSTAALQ
jgi:hypothetical protein